MKGTMRAKFRVHRVEKQHTTDGTQYAEHVVAGPVFPNDDPEAENTKFWAATPSGQLDLYLSNPDVYGVLKQGKCFYLDFTPAE